MAESDKRVLTLKKPLKLGDETLTKLEFREPTGGDMEDMALPPKFGDLLMIAAKIANQPPGVMRRLSADDARVAVEITSDFVSGGLETGETLPPS